MCLNSRTTLFSQLKVSRFFLVFILIFGGNKSVMAHTSPAFLGSWYVQTDNHIHFLQLNRNFSFVRFTLDLYQKERSHHGWGRFEITPSGKPNRLHLLLSYSVASQAYHPAKLDYQLQFDQQSLSLIPTSSNENSLILSKLTSHHTIGYWPNQQSDSISYLTILPSGHYVEVSPSDNQASFSDWQWGELINTDTLRLESFFAQ